MLYIFSADMMVMREKHVFAPLEGHGQTCCSAGAARGQVVTGPEPFLRVLHLPAAQLGCHNWSSGADLHQPKHVGSGVL